MPVVEVATPFRSAPIIPGGGVEYGDLSLRFIIDEDLKNYMSVWNWIRDYGNADSFEGEPEGYSDGNLMILTSNFNPQFIVNFENLIPVSLTSIPFDATVSEVEFFTATVTFKYHRYTVNDLSMQPLWISTPYINASNQLRKSGKKIHRSIFNQEQTILWRSGTSCVGDPFPAQ